MPLFHHFFPITPDTMAADVVPILHSSHIQKDSSVSTSAIVTLPPSPPASPRTIDEFFRQRSEEHPDHSVLAYPSSGISYVDYTYRQLDIFAFRVAQYYSTTLPLRQSSRDPETVVGLLGPSNLDYLVTILALTKLGFTVLFLSTRISDAAYTSLLETTGAHHLMIDQSFRETASTLQKSKIPLAVHEIAKRSVYDYPLDVERLDTRLDHAFDLAMETTKTSWIIHSSGSTSLPKPIFQSHKAALSKYVSIPIVPVD